MLSKKLIITKNKTEMEKMLFSYLSKGWKYTAIPYEVTDGEDTIRLTTKRQLPKLGDLSAYEVEGLR